MLEIEKKGYVKEISIVTIGVLTTIALLLGHDGTLLSLMVAVIAGIGGYQIGVHKEKERYDT